MEYYYFILQIDGIRSVRLLCGYRYEYIIRCLLKKKYINNTNII